VADIYEIAERYRKALLVSERKAATEMVRAYGESWKRIKTNLDTLTAQITAARAAGEEVSAAWLFQRDRLAGLQRQVESEIGRFAQHAEASVIAQQAEAVRAAEAHAMELMGTSLGTAPPGVMLTFNRLPSGAVQDLVGFLQDGSPLRSLLDELGPEASQGVRDALIAGVATGQGPREIARRARLAMGGNLVRALTIARTEVLRSYRESSRRSYQANDDVVAKWIRHEACDSRTCACCFALHGTEYDLEERFETHPNCRGALAPKTKTWEELGFEGIPETQAKVEKGTDLFEKLSDGDKEKVLGKAGFQAYKAGAVKLKDFVGRKASKQWGTTRYARSLRDILGPKQAEKWIAEAVKAKRMQEEPNRLIRELVGTKKTLSDKQWERVFDHVSQAGFATRQVAVEKELHGVIFQGQPLKARAGSLRAHLAKRVLLEGQWAEGTTAEQYLTDLKSVINAPDLQKAVYRSKDGQIVLGLLGRNRLPPERMGKNPKQFLWVIYSTDYGTITSGYQVSGIEWIRVPEGVRWM